MDLPEQSAQRIHRSPYPRWRGDWPIYRDARSHALKFTNQSPRVSKAQQSDRILRDAFKLCRKNAWGPPICGGGNEAYQYSHVPERAMLHGHSATQSTSCRPT